MSGEGLDEHPPPTHTHAHYYRPCPSRRTTIPYIKNTYVKWNYSACRTYGASGNKVSISNQEPSPGSPNEIPCINKGLSGSKGLYTNQIWPDSQTSSLAQTLFCNQNGYPPFKNPIRARKLLIPPTPGPLWLRIRLKRLIVDQRVCSESRDLSNPTRPDQLAGSAITTLIQKCSFNEITVLAHYKQGVYFRTHCTWFGDDISCKCRLKVPFSCRCPVMILLQNACPENTSHPSPL